MTTDITELALLVSKAKASVFTLEYISQFEPADIDSDDVDLRFEVDGRDTGTNVSIVDECGQAAKVIGALVEALEKAQRANAAQDDHINQQQDRIEQLERRNAEIGKYAGSLETSHKKLRESMAAIHNTVRLDGVNTRLSTILSASKCAYDESATVSELESRTVTVKLPSERFRYGDSDYDDGYVNGWNARIAEDTAALDGVGIKWEAE